MAMYGEVRVADSIGRPKTSPVLGWQNFGPYFSAASDPWRRFAGKGGEQEQLYGQFKDAYLSPEAQAQAKANADIYSNYTKGLFANQPNQFNNYQQVGDYLYGKFNDFSLNTANAGNRALNDRAASLGFGGSGTNSYLAKINADRITNNLAPVFANTTNAIGRDYGSIQGNTFRDTALRLGLADQDALGGYQDAVYGRPLEVAGVRAGQLAGNTAQLQALIDAYNRNIAGYQTRETNEIAKYLRPLDTNVSTYGGTYGAGGAGAPSTGQPVQPQLSQNNPYLSQIQGNPYGAMPYGGYPTTPGTTPAQVGSPQDAAWMNQFYGQPTPTYGDFGAGFGGAAAPYA